MKALLVLVLLITTHICYADSEKQKSSSGTRGGADMLICKHKPSFWKKKKNRYFLADSFITKKLPSTWHGSIISQEEYEKLFVETLNQLEPGDGDQIAEIIETINWEPVLELEELDDDKIKVPKDCQKVQLGIQYFDQSLVKFHVDRFESLTNRDKALFRIHEAKLSQKFQKLAKLKNTTAARVYLKTITVDNPYFNKLQTKYLRENYPRELNAILFILGYRNVFDDVRFDITNRTTEQLFDATKTIKVKDLLPYKHNSKYNPQFVIEIGIDYLKPWFEVGYVECRKPWSMPDLVHNNQNKSIMEFATLFQKEYCSDTRTLNK